MAIGHLPDRDYPGLREVSEALLATRRGQPTTDEVRST